MSVSQTQPGFLVTTSRGLDELLKQELSELCPDAEPLVFEVSVICSYEEFEEI